MKTLENTLQGSAAWHAARANHFCASEAAAAMGVSKYYTRGALLRQKATGLTEEVGPAKQRIFDAGHEAEALARPIAERLASVDFYPVVATMEIDGMQLLASFDGIDMLEEVVWENKLLNASLVQQVKDGDLEAHYWAQLEQQLLISGADRALFTTSDGTPEGTHELWYRSMPERRAQLLAAWKQFALDLAAYQPEEAPAPAAVGHTPETLPALRIEVTGMVTASNLADYKACALSVFAGINRELKTDQQFADAEKVVKWCGDVEARLAAAKQHALSQTESIDALFRAIDDISLEAKRTRLELDKLVKARKEAVRGEIVAGGIAALREHVAALNSRLGAPYMPAVNADFAGAIKGKRTIDSLNDAVDTLLANTKIEASATADRIQANLETLYRLGGQHSFLFADEGQIVLKAHDDLTMLVKSRIVEHQAKEVARIAAETARIRAEVEQQERAKAEHKARIAAEEIASAERKRAALEFIEKADAAAAELKAAQATPAGAELSPAAQVLNESEGAKRFAAVHPARLTALVMPVIAKPSTRELLNARLDRLSDTDLMRVLSFVQSRWPDAQAA